MSNKVKNMRSLLLILFSAISLSVSAQTITVKGNVKDTSGEPVIGATVLESGTQNGVITDVDGIFTIQLAKNASLTISYVGYQKKTVVVKDKKFISVNLTPDRSMMLDEVVVVG